MEIFFHSFVKNLCSKAVIILFFTSNVYAGLVMDQVRYEEGKAKKEKGVILMQDNKMIFNDLSNNVSSVFDLNKNQMVIIDHNNETYTVATPEDFIKAAEELTKGMKEEMEKHMQNLPPDQRKKFEELIEKNPDSFPSKNPKPVTLKVTNTGEIADIAGYSSSKYQVFRDSKLDEELWVSKSIGYEQEIDMSKMAKLMREFKKISHQFGGTVINEDEYIAIFENGGFPLKTKNHSFGNKIYIEEVNKITSREIEKSELEIPKKYKEKPLDTVFKRQY